MIIGLKGFYFFHFICDTYVKIWWGGGIKRNTKKKWTNKREKKQEKWKKRVRENSVDGVVQNDDTTWESDKNYVN